jgi:hypothetical protein
MPSSEPTESISFNYSKMEIENGAKDTVEKTVWTWSESRTGDTVDPVALDGGANAYLYDASVRLIGTSDALAPTDFFLV